MRTIFLFVLLAIAACGEQPSHRAAPPRLAPRNAHVVAANDLTRLYARSRLAGWQVRGRAAGRDCSTLLIETPLIMEDAMVEAMQYGAGDYGEVAGGVERFYRRHAFRGVVYRDASGREWKYGKADDPEPCRPVKRRALLVGIDDYGASRFAGRALLAPPPDRDWPDLAGAAGDANAMAEMLVLLYGFDRRDIVTLTDQNASREAILSAVQRQLVESAGPGDILLFYFAGHGSQVRNTRSAEPDKMDESLVPSDSRAGARDIRDKDLRRLFNRILDRGARLTVILDSCHSGSGARGLDGGATIRGVKPDLRDVADGSDAGPRPESRGALVLSASQDFDGARETRSVDGTFHGVFSWAWIRAMRDSSPEESAEETFLRAQARMRAETPFQEPVMAGTAEARLSPFLGARRDRSNDRIVVGVEKVQSDGTVMLQGGWAHGLSVGSELRPLGAPDAPRLKIIAMHGLGRSEARLATSGTAMPPAIHSGALLEVVAWAAPPVRPLRVWIPQTVARIEALSDLGRAMAAAAKRKGIHWVRDPIDVTPKYLLRPAPVGWELVGPGGKVDRFPTDTEAASAIGGIPSGSSLFVQFPVPFALAQEDGIEPVDRPGEADYILAGRYMKGRLSYAWLRPGVIRADRITSALPLRSDWTARDGWEAGLRDAVLRLRRIRGWQLLESPPVSRFAYRLAIRRPGDGSLVADGTLIGEAGYGLMLRAAPSALPREVPSRYVYAFLIDSWGKSILLFPRSSTGSVENYFPLPGASSPPAAIPLGPNVSFTVSPPYGIDTYFLLSTDEPLPNPTILEWDGVRTREAKPRTALEELLMMTGSARRPRRPTPATWSIERVVVESVAERR